MLSLATHTNIDKAAIITYTIDGLPGSIESKSFMYEATTISVFKKKLQAHDSISKNMTKPTKDFSPRQADRNHDGNKHSRSFTIRKKEELTP